ncbi:MAG TPA: hypothetical protein VHB72_03260 [Candidatus Saccharimonadales bacterium]|nr:hypothetical protein [Candidatus Saccharimonadales bacterium]
MSETQPGLDSLQQARPGDASFFIGRKGLRLPKAWLELPDGDSPVQPVTDLFDTVSGIWEANGHQTGRHPRHEVIALPARGYNIHALLFSRYFGKTDEELTDIDPPGLDRTRTRPLPLRFPDTIQGTEHFAVSIPSDIRRTGTNPMLSSGRVSLLLSRTYHFQAELARDLHPAAAGTKPEVKIAPDPAQATSHMFIGTKRLAELDEAQPDPRAYADWIAHYLVSELLADHSK